MQKEFEKFGKSAGQGGVGEGGGGRGGGGRGRGGGGGAAAEGELLQKEFGKFGKSARQGKVQKPRCNKLQRMLQCSSIQFVPRCNFDVSRNNEDIRAKI